LWPFGDSRDGQRLDVVGQAERDGWWPVPPGPADGRASPSVVWAGDELIVWGGEPVANTSPVSTGAAWDPTTGQWRSIAEAPIAPRAGHAAVWTGDEMVVCCASGDPQANSGAYDPVADSWRRLAGQSEMESIGDATAVWADGSMVVVGGAATGDVDDALSLDPINDQWRGISQRAPMRIGPEPQVFWTGIEAMVVPRPADTFTQPAAFDPLTGFWTELAVPPALLQLDQPSAVWTGVDLLLWGTTFEPGGGDPRMVGARLDPTTGDWAPIADAPLGDAVIKSETPGSSSAIWDPVGERMILYAGAYGTTTETSNVAVLAYHPATDTWQRLPSVPDQGRHPTMTMVNELLVIGDGPFHALDLSDYPPPDGDDTQSVFSEPTGSVLISDDGLGGAQIIDLDERRVVRRVLEGQAAGDQPFRLTPFGDEFLVGWGEIYSWDPRTASSRLVADSTIYVPAAEPDRVWLVDWSDGTIGLGANTYRYMTTDGTTLYEGLPTAVADAGDENWFPERGVPDGLVFQTDQGLAIWDAATDAVTTTFDIGSPGVTTDVHGDQIAWYDGQRTTLHLSTTDGTDTVIEPPAEAAFAIDSATFSPDGSTLAVALAGSGDHALMLIDTTDHTTSTIRGTPLAHDWAGRIGWGPDSDQLFIIENTYRQYRTHLGRWASGAEAIEYATLPFGGVITVQALAPSDATGALTAPDAPETECDYPQAEGHQPCGFGF
jgi:DNA-binding beta-propeller fold protein YncE